MAGCRASARRSYVGLSYAGKLSPGNFLTGEASDDAAASMHDAAAREIESAAHITYNQCRTVRPARGEAEIRN